MTGTVEDRIKIILTNTLAIPYKEIKPDSRITEDLGSDSLETMEIILAVEDEFNLNTIDDDVKGVKTVEDLITFVKKEVSHETKSGKAHFSAPEER